jgi:hypothetical protein
LELNGPARCVAEGALTVAATQELAALVTPRRIRRGVSGLAEPAALEDGRPAVANRSSVERRIVTAALSLKREAQERSIGRRGAGA